MKKLLLIAAFISTAICLSAQDIYLAGIITGFDINISGIDRPVDWLKIKGTLIFEKETLVIHTKRKGKDWVHDYKILSINERANQKDYISIDFTFRDFTDSIAEGSLRINNDETWTLEYKTDKTKNYYTGITLKEALFNLRRRY